MNYRQLASKGRYGDTELAHVNPQEANLLRALGGSGTINPKTGLREYSWFSQLSDYLFDGGLSDDVSSGWDSITGSDLNPSNWSIGGQNLGLGDVWNNTFGNEGLGGAASNMWNNVYGNEGLGNYFNDGQAGTDLSNMWNNTFGNEGLGGLLSGWLGGGNNDPYPNGFPSYEDWLSQQEVFNNSPSNIPGDFNLDLGGKPGGWQPGGDNPLNAPAPKLASPSSGGGGDFGGFGGGMGTGFTPNAPSLPWQIGGGPAGTPLGRVNTPMGPSPFQQSPLGNLFRGQGTPGRRGIRPRKQRGY